MIKQTQKQLTFKATSLLFILGIVLLLAKPQAAQGKTAEEIIKMVNNNYNKIETLKGRMLQRNKFGKQSQEVTTKFAIKRPQKINIESITSQQRQNIIFNGKTYWSYFPQEKKAIKIDKSEMTVVERQIIEPLSFFGLNPFDGMKKGFKFNLTGTSSNQFIISALPLSGGKMFSQVRVKIDSEHWIVMTSEIFDKDSNLISQTEYSDYKLFANSIWLPLKIKTKSILNKNNIEQDITFQRIELNSNIPDSNFEFTPSKDIKILSMSDLKNKKGR